MNAPMTIPLISRRDLISSVAVAAAWSLSQTQSMALAPAEQPKKANSLGLNLAAVRYWSTERPFQNLAMLASPPVSNRDGGNWGDGDPLELDKNGWLERIPSGHHAAIVLDLMQGHRNTTYEVRYDGEPNAIRIAGSQDLTFRKTKADERVLIFVSAPIKSLRIVEKGTRQKSLFEAAFLQRCKQFSVLRFMDWGQTNEDRPMDWKTRITPDCFTQADREVALEYLIDLCNQTECGMWYCVHHRADDDYVREAARLIKDRWKGDRPIYLEHSNEVWNGAFPQHHYCVKQSNDWLEYHVKRTARLAEIFRKEQLEITSVLGLQSVAIARDQRLVDMKVPKSINATAIAPYFGGHLGWETERLAKARTKGVKGILDECRQNINEIRLDIQAHRKLAEQLGMKLLAYEGGQHLAPVGGPQVNDATLVDLYVEANRHADMYQLHRDYLKMWDEESGGELMCMFNSVNRYSKFGCWGLLEYDGQDIKNAPKQRAVLDHLKDAKKV